MSSGIVTTTLGSLSSIWRLSRWLRQPGCRQQDAGLFQEYRLRLPSQSRNSTGVDCSEVFPVERGLRTAHGGENARSTPPPSGTHHRGKSSPGQEKVIQHVYGSNAIAEQRVQAPEYLYFVYLLLHAHLLLGRVRAARAPCRLWHATLPVARPTPHAR
ncbi:hypothetical protein B0H10DRAFT_773750 [Mycena sp. CBHHK59/15]|nr:hypothetical protein B0H10DRAFT_773750 [Mycena sp. CBHHK59/15]